MFNEQKTTSYSAPFKTYLLFAQFLIIGLIPGYVFSQQSNEFLVGDWTFCGDTDDSSDQNNHGIVYGAELTSDRFGNLNSAYHFNGVNSYIEVPHSTILNPTSLTLCCWINRKGDGNGMFDGIISKYSSGTNGYLLAMDDEVFESKGYLGFWIRSSDGNSHIVTHSTTSIRNNEWFHTAATYENGSVKLFINGSLINTQLDHTVNLVNNIFSLTFGAYLYGKSSYFYGDIDDIKIYSQALSNDDIQNLYDTEKVTSSIPTGIVDMQKTDLITTTYISSNKKIYIKQVSHSNCTNYHIYNLKGQLVLYGGFSDNQHEIDVQHLNKGLYIVKITDQSNNCFLGKINIH